MPSTSLRDISYDPDSRTLDVTFISSGRRYRYFAVGPEEHEALMRAFSKGSWFNRHIKPTHDFELLFDASGKRLA
jgi:hypothetical protein